MKVNFIDLELLHRPIRKELDSAIKQVIDQSAFVKSKYVENFEKEFSEYLGVEYVLSCGNGTDALEIALKTLGVGEGDEVLVPAMSWISTSEVVITAGAKPIFVDIDESTYCIDLKKIQDKINDKTKAIIPVHLYGRPVEMNSLMKIAKMHDLKVIEDCAQAHGATTGGKKVGSFGDAATFSFFPTKNLGAFGDAGAVVFKENDHFEKAKRLANHGQLKRHVHIDHGRNSRMDGLQAAVLSVKLKSLDSWNLQRNKLARLYHLKLKEVAFINLPEILENDLHVYHLFVIRSKERDKLKLFLEKCGVQTLIHYPKSLPFQACYSQYEYKKNDFSVSYEYQETILSLPFYPGMTEREVDYVCDNIKNFQN